MKTKKFNKSLIMKAAHIIFRNGESQTFSEALKKAWKAYKLKARLAAGVVEFAFRNLNGEIRKAVGTLKSGSFEYEYKGSTRKRNPSCIAYWDLEKNAYRSFRVGSLI